MSKQFVDRRGIHVALPKPAKFPDIPASVCASSSQHQLLALSKGVRTQRTHTVRPGSMTIARVKLTIASLNSDAVDHPAPNNPSSNGSHYDSNTPSDNELLTPLSASSSGGGHPHFQGSSGSPGMPPQEWSNMGNGNYNPYFPIPPAEHHGVYTHVMS